MPKLSLASLFSLGVGVFGLLTGGFLGFFPVEFMADALLPSSEGPTPYGDWRSMGYGLFVGVPLGATCGLLFAIWSTQPSKGDSSKEIPWFRLILIGLFVGVAAGFLFSGTPLFELFVDIGEVFGVPVLGKLAWFAVLWVLGIAAVTACGAAYRRFRLG